MSLQLTSVPAGSLQIKVLDPTHRELKLKPTSHGRLAAALSQTGDYQIWVSRSNSESKVSDYKLKVTIH